MNAYPQNWLQGELSHRLRRLCAVVGLCVCALAVSMLARPVALADSPFDLKTTSNLIAVPGHDGTASGAIHKVHDANTDFYHTNALPVVFPQSFSLEFWNKCDALTTNWIPFSITGNSPSVNFPGLTQRWKVHLGAHDYTSALGGPCDTSWHFTAVTFDAVSHQLKLYDQGALTDTFTASGTDLPTTGTGEAVAIASPGANGGAHLDEMKVSEIVLNGAQIASDYALSELDSDVLTWALWHFDTATSGAPDSGPHQTTLTASPSPSTGGQATTFTVQWTEPLEPKWLYFYPTGRGTGNCIVSCNNYVSIVEGVPLGSSGSYSFTYTYAYPGSYNPTIILSPDCGAFGINTTYSDCTVYRATTTLSVVGTTDADALANIELHFRPTGTDRVVNTPQPFSWRVDASAQCPGGSIASKKIYAGYPTSANVLDAGISLTGTSGSGNYTFTHTAEELGGLFTPYIQVLCTSGTGSIIYNGDTLYKSRAVALIIVSTDFNSYWGVNWTTGGKSKDYDSSTGSGAYFYTDAQTYARGQPVRLRYYYKTTFTPDHIVIFSNQGIGSKSYYLTGSYITNATEHNYTISYDSAGTQYPVIVVDGTGGATREIWLGGGQTQDPAQYLTVTSNIYGAGLFTFSNGDGIFGLDPSTFAINLGQGSDPFLQQVANSLASVVHAGLYVLNFGFSIIKSSPIFSFFSDTLHPKDGQIVYFPSQLFGWTIPYPPADKTATVHYADPTSGSKYLEYIITAAVSLSVLRYTVLALF